MIGRCVLLLGALAPAMFAGDAWEALAQALRRNPAEQRAAISAVLSAHPQFLPAHYNLGTLLISSDTTTAIRHLEAATRADDPLAAADAWHNLGLARWQAGLVEESVAAMVEAARRNPAMIPARDAVRRAALAKLDAARLAAEAAARRLRLAAKPLSDAHVGEPYDDRLLAQGGAGGYRFAAINSDALPPGLRLLSDGRIVGTPPQDGAWSFAVMVADSATGAASATVALTVLPPPRITTQRLDEAVSEQPYRATVEASGLLSPRWTIDGLPDGLQCDPLSGTISGTPRTAGTVTLLVSARDEQRSASASLSLTVAEVFAPDLSRVPPATAWASYRAVVAIRGPLAAYVFSASATAGLSMSAQGQISGTPDAAGRVVFTTTIDDGRGHRRVVPIPITVNPPPVIDEPEPITLHQGQVVQRAVKHQGGSAPLQWRLAEGSLPAGVRLDADGHLRGAATATGSSTATIELRDRWSATTRQAISFTVEPPTTKPEPQDHQDQQQQKDQDSQAQKQPGNESSPQQANDSKTKDQDAQQQAEQQQAEQKKAEQQKNDAESLRAAAAERFLDQIPDGDKAALRQLLLGGTPQPPGTKQPW